MREYRIWGFTTGIQYDDRPLMSYYNWLLDTNSGLQTTYRGLEKNDTNYAVAII